MLTRRDLLQLGVVAGLAGCGRRTPALTVAYHPWSGYAPLQLVRTLDWLAPDRFRALDTGAATESVAALRNGQAQAAALTLDELLQARARGLPLQVVALLDVSVGADAVLGRPGIRTLAQLQGRRLGLETGAVGQLMAMSALESAGISPKAVRLVPLPFGEHVAAWQGGLIDALVTFEPVASRLVRQGAERLFDSRQLPPGRVIADVLAIHADALPDQGEHLSDLLLALFRAQHHLHRMALDAQYRLAPWLGLPPQQVLSAFQGVRLTNWAENRRQLFGRPAPLEQDAAHLGAFMLGQGLLTQSAPLDDLIASRYLPLEDVL